MGNGTEAGSGEGAYVSNVLTPSQWDVSSLPFISTLQASHTSFVKLLMFVKLSIVIILFARAQTGHSYLPAYGRMHPCSAQGLTAIGIAPSSHESRAIDLETPVLGRKGWGV